MAATLTQPKRRIAVADDNPNYLDQKSRVVQMAGFEPLKMQGRYRTIKELLDELKKNKADAFVCDHKLNEGNYAKFEGAEAVAALYDTRTPALLVTDYVESDLNSIRKHRKKVPVLISGGSFTQSAVNHGLKLWEEEVLEHNIPLQRRPRRTLLMVREVDSEAKGHELTVIVPRWNQHNALNLPLDFLPSGIRRKVKKGTMLTADVNTEAVRSEDLFFDGIELTPDEDLQNEPA
jgi:hypothetical protein